MKTPMEVLKKVAVLFDEFDERITELLVEVPDL